MSWTLAASLDTLRAQVNDLAPTRSKTVDGTIGDAAHQAQSWSDHNPDAAGVVRALDLTHDPAGGLDAGDLATALAAARDHRIKYLIWNRRVLRSYAKPGIPAWTWAPYTGDNPHTDHLHVSVVADDRALNPAPWTLEDIMALTDEDVTRIAARVWSALITNPVTGKPAKALAFLQSINRTTYAIQLAQTPDKLTAAVAAGIRAAGANTVNVDALARAIVLELGKET